ncbi:Lysoplasmalogenase [Balamuthia mandrillaris]
MLVELSVLSSAGLYLAIPWRPFSGSWVLKGLPIALLALQVIKLLLSPHFGDEQRHASELTISILALALVLHCLGDVFLELTMSLARSSLLVPAVAAFAAGHFLYMLAFLTDLHFPLFLQPSHWLGLLCIVLGGVFILNLVGFSSSLGLSVRTGDASNKKESNTAKSRMDLTRYRKYLCVYVLLLVTMAMLCLLSSASKQENGSLWNLRTIGGSLYLISDGMIGMQAAQKGFPLLPPPFNHAIFNVFIWPCYYLGQYFIVMSMVDIHN